LVWVGAAFVDVDLFFHDSRVVVAALRAAGCRLRRLVERRESFVEIP